MKMIFSRFKQGGKTIAKYLVFSLFLLTSLFVGGNLVHAADYSNYDGYTTAPDSSITPIKGELNNSCDNSEYTLISSSYSGKNSAGSATSTQCISYTDTDTNVSYYYLQAQTSDNNVPSTWNMVTFSVKGLGEYQYIILVESGFSKSEDDTDSHKTDYDLYNLKSGVYEYKQVRSETTPSQPDRVDANKKGTATYSSGIYTFTYYLRNSDFKEQKIEVYFYNGDPDVENHTAHVDIEYILAKPISDYKYNVDKTDVNDPDNETLTDLCSLDAYEVCLKYSANYNNNVTDSSGTKINTFEITFSKDAAFYFSTVNSHKLTDIDTSKVRTYNSIYATNTFYNEGEGASDAIVYDYFNFIDNTDDTGLGYDEGVTALVNYKFTLTIDANGDYQFYMTDIFGNHLSHATHADDDDTPSIKDVSNRTLTIYYLVYTYDGSGNITGVEEYGDNINAAILAFQLKQDSLDNLTNKNVTVGLEFYSKVDIKPSYAVPGPIDENKGEILQNPLYYEGQNATASTKSELRVYTGDATSGNEDAKLTYFCRTINPTSTDCITTGSEYTKKALLNTQTINADETTGKLAVSNTFNPNSNSYYQGYLANEDGISATARANRTNLVLNENGIFFVRIEDIYGNSTSSTISVSIIDQHKPVITVNGSTTSLNNVICTSMYVVGAGGNIATYPERALTSSDCASNSVLYNQFAPVGGDTEKKDTIRNDYVLSRTTDTITLTNGFYNTSTNLVNFNYADAIRMSLLRVSDSMVVADAAKTNVEKSYYEKTNNTYTAYALYTKDRGQDSSNSYTNITDTLTRANYGYKLNGTTLVKDYSRSDSTLEQYLDLVIANNYTQYSSELYYFDENGNKTEFVVYNVYSLDANNSATLVCNSNTHRDNSVCDDIVNALIDKGINFRMEFSAKDYVGNVSQTVTVNITVQDDTTPGITTIKSTGEVDIDPIMAKNNIDTTCRLEIGSVIQTKKQLLECYGFLNGTKYNYVDNSTGYLAMTATATEAPNKYVAADFDATSRIYKYVLSNQLLLDDETEDDSYYKNIKVFICKVAGATECTNWKEITDDATIANREQFEDAGSYQIKFELTDVGHQYKTSQTHTKNKTTIILCYYVNPRILLVRPIEKTVEYGSYNAVKTEADNNLDNSTPTNKVTGSLNIDFCVYASTNTDSFFYNLFSLKYNAGATYKDTYDFVDQNYEGATFGLVYCTNKNTAAVSDGTEAVSKELEDLLVTDKATIRGSLGITYATGTNKYNMQLSTYNAYQDAGYYYITMGDLRVDKISSTDTKNYSQNYVLRLHPSFLLDGMDPNDKLVNYNDASIKDETQYKYGHAGNTAGHGETVSNVLYTVTQRELIITANGGSKTYGTADTNYPQASNTNAIINVSNYVDNNTAVSTAGYLNGFTITGLIENDWVRDFTDTTKDSTVRYNHIIQGFLRRELGESAGKYRICNHKTPGEITSSACDTADFDLIGTENVELTMGGNVYYVNASGTYSQTAAADQLRFGMYVNIDGSYYKLTHDNTNLSAKTFKNTIITTAWKYNYTDTDYSVKILVNDNNANQNYYITYVGDYYTINPGKIIVQPGSNQGKEYSNPQHNDPMYEIIVYGETRSITASEYGASFTGFTETITDKAYPDTPVVGSAPYNNTSGGYEADNDLYFGERRTRATDVFATTSFVYKFNTITLSGSSTFDWMGSNYTYNSGSGEVCLTSSKIGSDYTQCQTNKIGSIYDVAVSGNTVTITTSGKLTYQNYTLLADSTDVGGKAYIERASKSEIKVGWYSYVFTDAAMHVVKNGKNFCNVTEDTYQYTVDGTDECSNYNLAWDDNAPSNTKDSTTGQITTSLTTEGVGNEYAHNGVVSCKIVGETGYSFSCGDNVTKIKFSIFKRDVIISFNAYNVVYGNVYSFFSAGVFKIENETGNTPEYANHSNESDKRIITCYAKKSDGAYLAKNGSKYDQLETCDSVDHGISTSDTWGADGLNLQLYLDDNIAGYFDEDSYPVPAGLYYVFARIGSYDTTHETYLHENYNLVYVDFNIIQATTSNVNEKDGAVEITSKGVELKGTYYQKEYGQGKYNSYGVNGEQLTSSGTDGSGQYEAKLSNLKVDATNKIFDNHYYHCVSQAVEYGVNNTYNGVNINNKETLNYGCSIISLTGTNDASYGYGNIGNIFGFIVPDMVNLAAGKADDIYSNFAGTPTRPDLLDSTDHLNDPYGLLADVGYYTIDLTGIYPVVVQAYPGFTAGFDPTTTLRRYTNYKIDSTVAGRLYITPASINIDTAGSQTKMYGCAYNTFNTAGTTYTYGEGYTNCVESNGTLYDLGYKYTVSNDKYNYLMSELTDESGEKTLDYTALGVTICTLANQNKANGTVSGTTACNDIVYPAEDPDYKYTIEPNYSEAKAATETETRKPLNTALNNGVLFRIPITITDSTYTVTYDYKTYFDYANGAQIAHGTSGRIYQNQTVGDYALTLGNLDSRFNSNVMCDAMSVPNSDDDARVSNCKNFIINYNGNNTSLHTLQSSQDEFASDTFTLNLANEVFTITTRNVVLNTEYNYKIYGDTDPVEGFTCQNLKDMFGIANYTARGYCSADDTFIETGVSRYYAADNSLAKAPWTGWTKDAIDGATSYNTYNDILFDVIDSETSRIYRESTSTAIDQPTRNDAGGKYYYVYRMYLNSLNSNTTNYVINYVTFNNSDLKDSTSRVVTPVTEKGKDNLVKGANVGFATIEAAGGLIDLSRWYGTVNASDEEIHACHSVKDNGGNASAVCNNYTGKETYNFYIKGIQSTTYDGMSLYKVGDNNSVIVSEVYFEIIRREVYIMTLESEKDYGNEEDYLDFTLKLVTPGATPGTYVDITYSQKWGDPNSLSKADYDAFFPGGTFNLKNFMGTQTASDYRGKTLASADGDSSVERAFGIYFYRTYGENVGDYVIVACATQFNEDNECDEYYRDIDDDATRIDSVGTFVSTPDNNYNASNYIVHTIPSTITINKRGLSITPDSDQGFQYGNFVTGILIDPITYTETYNGTTQGLVNGGILNTADHVNNQIALCIYDITGRVTCINDRQNTSTGSIVGYVTTTLHAASTYNPALSAGILAGAPTSQDRLTTTYTLLKYNVYNDEYTRDNDVAGEGETLGRYALDRKFDNGTIVKNNQRYNRNVGTYTIVAGELDDNRYCNGNDITKNCLNPNYSVLTVNETITYVITPANISVTPKENQNKIYGTEDIEIAFDVVTTFVYKINIDATNNIEFDGYHCATGTCQSQTSFGSAPYATSSGTLPNVTISIKGFAYGENVLEADNTTVETDFNYGISRVSNKTNSEAPLLSVFTKTTASTDRTTYPKYYDKYCKDVDTSKEECTAFTQETRYASLTYETTSRILLGYFYVKEYNQTAKDTVILNGIKVALNEFDTENYTYTRSMDQETPITFKTNKLNIDATINDVTKVYGQATDSHKADAFTHTCEGSITCVDDHAVIMTEGNTNDSKNNENRLEYNFNVTGASVNGTDTVILTAEIAGHYYTQTGLPEYKNVHLGLSVVREQGTSCLIKDDMYGCEDVGTYKLVFRKIDVTNNVDHNYNVTFGGDSKETEETTAYVHVNMTDKSFAETLGMANNTVAYKVYSSEVASLDSINATTSGNATAGYTFNEIVIIKDYNATLTINKRNIEFYVGTYDSNGVVAERFVIEQNEEVPEFPLLHAPFTTSTTTVKSKEVYYNTWFDTNEYGLAVVESGKTHVARQVRTKDNIITTLKDGSNNTDRYGVGICRKSSTDIQGVKYDTTNCSADDFIQFHVANTQDASGAYMFNTMNVGNYPILRDPQRTFVTFDSRENTELVRAYETKNYITHDYNGTLVVYEDQTAPIIMVGNSEFAIEANAHEVLGTGCVVNSAGQSYSYTCDVAGLTFTEQTKSLGSIIEYITTYYSDYGTTPGTRNANAIDDKVNFRLPDVLPNATTMAGWIYQPVNNIGNSGNVITQYKVDRSANTYAFDNSNVIDSRLEAISSILSFYNVNSYDFGYVRNGKPITKRYTPRYYFFIEKDIAPTGQESKLNTFDPTYVGDFKITIYAIDNVGNQSSVDVTLKITDTTKPIVSQSYLFNTQVVCKNNTKCVSDTIADWRVAEGYVPINAFTRYNANGQIDDVNGTYIKVASSSGGQLKDIFKDIQRYSYNGTSYEENIMGEYVYVAAPSDASYISATEVEHKYWYNNKKLYLVVVNGEDNSYIDPEVSDTRSQWHTYYTVNNGTSWYKYDRHAVTGTEITFQDGISTIYTRIMDTGRKFTTTSSSGQYTYYNSMYLSTKACNEVNRDEFSGGCVELTGQTADITQVKDLAMDRTDPSDDKYTFSIHGMILTYDVSEAKVTWPGQASSGALGTENSFTYGIMSCKITGTSPDYIVNCNTLYDLLYAANDKKDVSKISYTLVNSANVNDEDELTIDEDSAEVSRFYYDRKYIFIDTVIPTVDSLNDDPFLIYEYEKTCQKVNANDEARCNTSFKEQFLKASDSKVTTTGAATVTGTATTLPIGNLDAYDSKIALFTGNKFIDTSNTTIRDALTSFTNKSSGLLVDTSIIMMGSDTYDNGASLTTFNRNDMSIVVYLVAKRASTTIYYKFTAVLDRSDANTANHKYVIARQTRSSQTTPYPLIKTYAEFTNTYGITGFNYSASDMNSIEEVIQYIVSTESIADVSALQGAGGYVDAELDFSINYRVMDAAGNVSASQENVTIRGVTYFKYESTVTFNATPANAGVSFYQTGYNSYVMTLNQGASLVDAITGFEVHNIDNEGHDNVGNIKQSLYYNGEVIFEDANYSANIIEFIGELATAPGAYTLKLSSTREVEDIHGNTIVVDDTPLELTFDVVANVANVGANDYTFAVFALISMILASIAVVGIEISKKRKKA